MHGGVAWWLQVIGIGNACLVEEKAFDGQADDGTSGEGFEHCYTKDSYNPASLSPFAPW